MKKTIMFVMISVALALASCSPPEEETVTALSDHALISSQETVEKKTEKESTRTESTEAESSAATEEELPVSPGGIRAEGPPAKIPESAEPSGEEYIPYHENASSDGGDYDPPAQTQTAHQQDTAAAHTTEVPETVCRHGSVYISGACPATCIAQGYSGDTYCALCGALLETGHSTGYADHDWIAETIHERAYLTCYCGLIFYSADEHDRHVNEMAAAGEPAGSHGCVWTPARDVTIYTCSVCGETLNY